MSLIDLAVFWTPLAVSLIPLAAERVLSFTALIYFRPFILGAPIFFGALFFGALFFGALFFGAFFLGAPIFFGAFFPGAFFFGAFFTPAAYSPISDPILLSISELSSEKLV